MNKLSKEEIPAALTKELEARPEILFAYLFGSCAEGSSFRDVDVAVYVTDAESLKDSLTYTIHLSLALEKIIGWSVDVILLNTAPDHLIHAISGGKVLLDRDGEFRSEFVVSAWRRYFDIQPKRRQALKDMMA